MKIWKIAAVLLLLVAVITSTVGCGSKSDATASAQNQEVTVQRGNLAVEITAAGNLALSQTEDLAFEVAGTVVEISVEEGDSVKEGQELAKLDTTEWDKQLKTLEEKLVAAQRNLANKQSSVTRAERQVTTLERQVTAKEAAVTTAERQVTAKEFAVRQAELNVQVAENNLNQIADVKKAQDAIDNAQDTLKLAKNMLLGVGGVEIDSTYWNNLKTMAEEQLADAQAELQKILTGSNINVSDDVALKIAQYQLQAEQSQRQLDDAQTAVEDAKQGVEDAKLAVDDANYAVEDAKLAVKNANLDVEDAQSSLEDAQSNLDEAKSLSPIITAPFDGFIPKINVSGGDEVLKGTVAMQLADPNKFEAEIVVSETDIQKVRLNSEASVQLSAVPGLPLPAKVTHIAPTATIQSGVVNYKVTVEVQPMQDLIQARQQARSSAFSDNASSDNVSAGTFRQRGAGASQGQTPAVMPENFQLRQGLTATVTIIVQQATNVLLVPNTAISTQGRQTYVQVVLPDGTTEQRAIQAGISNWQYTEVTSGLNEGDKVIIPKTATTTTTTQQQQPSGQPPGAIRIPGMGGLGR